jgi:hypothetical protein
MPQKRYLRIVKHFSSSFFQYEYQVLSFESDNYWNGEVFRHVFEGVYKCERSRSIR